MENDRTISLLDCTLRDGGCVNDFAFGIETMRKLLRAIEQSGVRYVELGYLDEARGSKERRTMYADTGAIERNRLLENKKKDMTYLVMIDYGKYPAEALPPRRPDGLDGIRLCFHKKDLDGALRAGRHILEKGYVLMLQAMVNTRYSDEEFENLLRQISVSLPELRSLSIVDSFGCMSEEDVLKRLKLADHLLPVKTAVGLHTHNNRELSMSHARNAAALSFSRELIIDGTLFGMGKGAGNLRIEDFAGYLNETAGTDYQTEALQEVIQTVIRPLHRIYDWGSCPEYELSARYRTTPSYAKEFYRVQGLSLEQTEMLLSRIPDENRDSYNAAVGKRLLEQSGWKADPVREEETLLDARGYAMMLEASAADPVRILYLGAERTEHPGLKYDQDPYVVSHVRDQEFSGLYRTVLKDRGIGRSGLRAELRAESDVRVRIAAAGETLGEIKLEPGKTVSVLYDVSGLCREERAYLEKLHRILYLLLAEVDRICTKHNIRYYLIQGGLLGALRHGKIIPWDDDLDLAMTRENFERFREAAPRELKKGFAYLDCSEIGGFLDFMCRVMYMEESVPGNVFRKVEGRCRPDLPNHQPLDIFILDRIPDDSRKAGRQMLLIRAVYGLGMGHRSFLNMKEYRGKGWKTRLSVRILSLAGKCIPLKWIYRLHDRFSTMYNHTETESYFMSNGFLPFIQTRYDCSWFTGNRKVRLGTMEVPVPEDPEASLRRTYYDFYHYPPVEKRIPEHGPGADGVH